MPFAEFDPMSARIGVMFAIVLGACDAAESTVGPAAEERSAGIAFGQDIVDRIDNELARNDALVLVSQTGSILHALNEGEIGQSDIALNTGARTQNFAYSLVIAHLQSNVVLDEVSRAYGVGFVSTEAEAMLAAQANAGLGVLKASPPALVDRAFLKLQIRMYAAADVMLDKLERENDSEPMNEFLAGYHAMVEDHLDRSEQQFDNLD